jgi:hypothetical protein
MARRRNIFSSNRNVVTRQQQQRQQRQQQQRQQQQRQQQIDTLTKQNVELTTKITGLNFNIRDISNQQNFYKDKIYGTGKETGFLNIIKKNSKLENFSNIEGLTATVKNLDDVTRENILLESQIQQNTNNYTADDTQVFYKKQQYYRQKEFNKILYFVFYILVLCFISYLFIFNATLGIYLKIFITIILAIYPFIIEYIKFGIYFIIYYLYSFVSGAPFNMDSYYGFSYTT